MKLDGSLEINPGYTCRTTVIFGTLKDGSLEINNIALNNCFSYRNSSKIASMLCEKYLKKKQNKTKQKQKQKQTKTNKKTNKTGFCHKAQNFVYFGPYDFVQISPSCGANSF